jgi:hypothetical protein
LSRRVHRCSGKSTGGDWLVLLDALLLTLSGADAFVWSFGQDQVPAAGFQVFAEVVPVMAGSANAITDSMTSAKVEGSRSSSSCLRRQACQRCWPMAP